MSVCFFCSVIHFLKISEFFIYLFLPVCFQDRESKGMEFSSRRWEQRGGILGRGNHDKSILCEKMSNKNVKTTHLTEDYKYIAPDFG